MGVPVSNARRPHLQIPHWPYLYFFKLTADPVPMVKAHLNQGRCAFAEHIEVHTLGEYDELAR